MQVAGNGCAFRDAFAYRFTVRLRLATLAYEPSAKQPSAFVENARNSEMGYIGRPNRVYEVLNHKRPLTMAMAWNLHRGLGIPAESLIKQAA